MRDEVERASSAVVRFECPAVVVSGLERSVAAALRILDAKAADGPPDLSLAGIQSREVFRQGGRNLESEDSSYDSDYEAAGEGGGGTPDCCCPHHDDVSRTVSDTLAAEFAEYVTTGGPGPPRALDSVLADPDYTSRVEFALKLGYTEGQVQVALQKLGPQPSQNELLAELIKLGAASTTAPHQGQTTPARSEQDSSSSEGSGVVEPDDPSNLRHIVIDGSNVAMSHGNKECFSCRGIQLCVDWFRARGHPNITVFVPRWRKENSRPDAPIKDQEILAQLERDRLLVFTPSRHVGGRRLVCYDDRYVLRLAVECDGIVVSNDNYRDLAGESPEFKRIVEERLLMYSFVNDRFMPPDDPLGRHGPTLDNFLRKSHAVPRPADPLPPPCPYGKKCTYGNKCKYHHPERGNQPQKSVTERLAEQAKIPLQEVKSRGLTKSRESSPGDKLKPSSAVQLSGSAKSKKQPLSRTKSLVPSSALSESPSEKMNVVERTKSDGSSVKPSEEKSQLQKSGLPCYISSSGYGPSWPPQISLTAEAQSSPSNMGGNWAAIPPTLPPNIPGSCAEIFLEPDGGGHLFVAKRLSDPDNKPIKSFPKQPPPPSLGHQVPETTNLHRKLQRQLTLNPAYDPRLVQLGGYVDRSQILSPPQESYGLLKSPPDSAAASDRMQQQQQRASSQENIHLLQQQAGGYGALGAGGGGHVPLGRMGSDSLQMSSHVWGDASAEHQAVTRIASAPDSYNQWPPSARMQHLNSTSDTRLNLYPEAACHQGAAPHPHLPFPEMRQWMSQGLDPPRPMSSAGIQMMGSSWQGSSLNQPVRPSSVPPPGLMPPQGRAASPDFSDSARYRLYFHLASIFPKEQVQAVMDLYPQETHPQKICAAILSMFPKG